MVIRDSGQLPLAVDMMFFMAFAVASSDLAALIFEHPKNFTENISRSELPFSLSSSEKSVNFVANVHSSPTSVHDFLMENNYLVATN